MGFQARRAKPEKRNALTLMALILSVGISAFFWLPVALEQDAVNLSSLIGDGGHFDFRNHFLSLGELLGPTKWLDWGATEPEFALNLGMVQWLLALLGMAGLATGHARQRAQGAFFAVFAVGFILLMTRASLVIWATVPMMPFLQFPWRLLGPVAAILAILGGAGVQSLSNYLAKLARREPKNGAPKPAAGPVDKGRIVTRMKQWFPALVMLLVLVQSLPLSMVPPWPETPWDTSAPAVMEIERQGRWLGTTSTADFVPRTVEILPRPQEQMVDAFIAGGTLDRVNRATLPQGTAVKAERITPLHTRYQVSSEQPFFLRLFQFSFPGWQARIDGAVAETTIGRPEGFLVVPVPAGEHTVDISFVETTERRIAWLLSGVSAFAAIMLAALIRRTAGRGAREERAGANSKGSHTSSSAALTPFLLTSLLFLLVFALAHRQGWFYFRSTDWTAIPAEHDLFADLGDQVALIGYDAPEMAEPGDSIEVTLYWKAQQDVEINYQVFLHLLDSSGTPVTQSDKLNPGDFPTRRWPTDKYVRDTHRLKIPETITPGVYRLSTGLWVQSEGWRLPLFDRTGEQIGDSFVVAPIEVR